MKRFFVLSGLLWMSVLPASLATAQERQQLLSTAEWVEMANVDQKVSLSYLKGTIDTLAAIGNFTCKTPVALIQSSARIQLDFHDNPENMQRWFIFALMADLTRHHHCRFLDTERLTYSNGKLAEWEATR